MWNVITPEKAGISSKRVEIFLRKLERRGLAMHSVLMMRGYDIFAECYYAPFDKDFCHRMYSQTKSFVAVAIGLLIEDGLLSVDDRIADHFPEKIDRELPPFLAEQTVRDMLTMQTCGMTPSWFTHSDRDRTHLYFAENYATRPAGTIWEYDSPGSQVLCALVEKLSGKKLFDFMNERIFRHLGTFKTAYMLKTGNEDTFGDSAMLCTTRDLASFAKFVMNYGEWHGKRLINEDYLRTATSALVYNETSAWEHFFYYGYGYQIWRAPEGGFAFVGMGQQLSVCLPDRDFIFCCTADCQGHESARDLIGTALYEEIVDFLSDEALPEDPAAYASLKELCATRKLLVLNGPTDSPFKKELSGKTYLAEKNRCGITRFRFEFEGDGGTLFYTNAQGDKELPFSFGRNTFCKFPQLGYSTEHASLRSTRGEMYNCAVSAAFREERKLMLKVQIIDDYFGNFAATFSFRPDGYAVVHMEKSAEDFLEEYHGTFNARLLEE